MITQLQNRKRIFLVAKIKIASGLVRAAICSILTDSKFSEESERWRLSKQQVVEFLQQISSDEKMDQFDDFAGNLMKTLEKNFFASISTDNRSKSVLREKLWIKFHYLRITELPKLWNGFSSDLSPLVCQHVNYKLYVELMRSNLSQDSSCSTNVDIPELNEDEENILRYAAGYVPFKLLKKYEKSLDAEFAASVSECLLSMSVNGDESDLMEYTRSWTLLVNRGGLFEVNDLTYTLFKEIEMKVRYHLFTIFHGTKSDDDRVAIIKAVTNSDDVRFYWTILSVDILVEKHAIRLLEEIVGLWVSIRGFSIAGAWLEQHKQVTKVSTAKSRSLRKDLKQKSQKPADHSDSS